MSELPPIQTESGKKFAGRTPVVNAPLIADGDVNEVQECKDQFWLSPQEREQYDIKPYEDHGYIRAPKYWEQHEMKDRASEWMRQAPEPGTRRVIRHNGELVYNGDLILVAKPKAEAERDKAAQEKATEDYLEALEHGDIEGAPRWRSNKHYIEDYARDQHQQNQASGLIGPTAGMDAEAVFRQYGRDKVEREMAFHRNGGRHIDATPRAEAYMERAESTRPREKASVGYSRKVEENWPADMKRKR